ncbi:MAG: hypothetical protein OXG70_08040 [Cyanobacteria bacterium MAG IRC1_bin_28]|nr:hypothetical protein [Cyanobacteria bacterium MAG IRC1_bin_28]MYI88305.1 hypothetical protein [Synechococcus sp. SB0672_bin_10]
MRWLSLSGASTQEPGFDPTGAAMPDGEGCQPQIIVTVPDFPEAEHVSASTVVVDFGESRICTQSADDPATFRQWLQKQRDFWFPGEQTPSNGAAP